MSAGQSMQEAPKKTVAARKILAVVVNWNGAEMTRDCCASLASQTHRNVQVRVVDNGSTRHTVEELRALCPGAEVVGTGRNLGFAGGVNAGLRAGEVSSSGRRPAGPGGPPPGGGGGGAPPRPPDGAAGSPRPLDGFDYVWLVNNDAVCDPDALARLLAVAEADPRLAAVGCAMRESDGRGGERRVAAGKRMRPPFYIPLEPREGEPPDYLCGACVLMRREALADVGPLDEGFFFFFEDADWSFRAVAKGWRLGVADGEPVRHLGGGTIRRNSRNRSRFYRAGHVLFLRRHARFPLLAALPPFLYRLAAEMLRLEFSAARGSIEGFFAAPTDRRARGRRPR
ncbi:MAG: glycosyltransferase family 2 protein [Kiritimatiellia bacterium]|jgi:GT2 family glycosyltransferase